MYVVGECCESSGEVKGIGSPLAVDRSRLTMCRKVGLSPCACAVSVAGTSYFAGAKRMNGNVLDRWNEQFGRGESRGGLGDDGRRTWAAKA